MLIGFLTFASGDAQLTKENDNIIHFYEQLTLDQKFTIQKLFSQNDLMVPDIFYGFGFLHSVSIKKNTVPAYLLWYRKF